MWLGRFSFILALDHLKEKNMSQSTKFVIETQGLNKSFGEVQALQNVDLRVPCNSIYGFLGPNGAGKTSLVTEWLDNLQVGAKKEIQVENRVWPYRLS
jgi:ABC-type branched-subunit amino acid transport system ATPase component